MVEWMAPDISDGLVSVDPATGTVVTGETYKEAALVNVIPAQKAGAVARQAGLADASGWCPVDAGSMASAMDPAVFVIGDAAIGGDIPKSAFAAGSQARGGGARVARRPVRRGCPIGQLCQHLLEPHHGRRRGEGERALPAGDGRIHGWRAPFQLPASRRQPRRRQLEENADWYRAMVAGMFG